MSKLIIQGAKDILKAQAEMTASRCDRGAAIATLSKKKGWTEARATQAVDSAIKLSALKLAPLACQLPTVRRLKLGTPASKKPNVAQNNMIVDGYRVEVWHATGSGYKTVADGLTLEQARARAREYLGADAKGVRLANRSGWPVDPRRAQRLGTPPSTLPEPVVPEFDMFSASEGRIPKLPSANIKSGEVYYHGTTNKTMDAKGVLSLTSTEKNANRWMKSEYGESSEVIPFTVKKDLNVLHIPSDRKNKENLINWLNHSHSLKSRRLKDQGFYILGHGRPDEDVIKALRDMGYDGVKMGRIDSGIDELMVFDAKAAVDRS